MTVAPSASLQSRLTRALPTPSGGAIISTVGKEGVGKTGWALSAAAIAPASCLYIPMDRLPQGDYVNGLIEQHKIYVPKTNFKIVMTPTNRDAAVKLWGDLSGLTKDAITDKAIRTIIWDTGVYAWELIRLARFGKLDKVMPHHYGPVNMEFRNLLLTTEEYGKILIIIHSQKKEYKANAKGEDSWTGRYERAGFNDMGFVANAALEHYRADADETGAKAFGVRVLQNKLKPEMDGAEMQGDMCSFPYWAYETWGGDLMQWMGLE